MIKFFKNEPKLYLTKLPWLRQGLFTNYRVEDLFGLIRSNILNRGYIIAAEDAALFRLCFYSSKKQHECTCLNIVWLRRYGTQSYVSFGIEPAYWLFSTCNNVHHLEKMRRLSSIIHEIT